MLEYKGIRFDDHADSEDDGYSYSWSQICTSCACEHGIYAEAAKSDCPVTLICGVEGCENEADFYVDFDGTETIPDCPLGGVIDNDCAGCANTGDYHYQDGECVPREVKQCES